MPTSLDTQSTLDSAAATPSPPQRGCGGEGSPVADRATSRCPIRQGGSPHRSAGLASATGAVSQVGPGTVSGAGWVPKDLRRWTLAAVGVFATTLAIVGAILPGMPTTIFVIIAAWCFTRSCPVLEEKLLRNRLLRPSMEIVDGTRPFTRRARVTAIATMVVFASTSVALLAWSDRLTAPTLGTIVALVAIGAVAISMYRPMPRSRD